MAEIEFIDALPPIHSGPRALKPEVVEFLEVLKANPGKWAKYPLDRKTKPELPEGFEAAKRAGILYVSFTGAEA